MPEVRKLVAESLRAPFPQHPALGEACRKCKHDVGREIAIRIRCYRGYKIPTGMEIPLPARDSFMRVEDSEGKVDMSVFMIIHKKVQGRG